MQKKKNDLKYRDIAPLIIKKYFSSVRFRIAEGWVWKDDIDYSGTARKSSTIVIDKPDSNQTSDELPPSVAQDTGLDYGQGRYLELEGVEDYILWQKGYLEPTRKQVNRK